MSLSPVLYATVLSWYSRLNYVPSKLSVDVQLCCLTLWLHFRVYKIMIKLKAPNMIGPESLEEA